MRGRRLCLMLVFAFATHWRCIFGGGEPGRKMMNWGNLPENLLPQALVMHARDRAEKFDEDKTPWVEQVSTKPRAFYFHNFLTEEERAHIVKVAAPQMRRSTVVGQDGKSVVDNIRTSYGMFIRRLQDDVIERIERRIALWTHLPIENQEDIQVLRYGINQTYGAHYDSSEDENEPGPHHRLATFLMYLSDVEEGGETAFPHPSSEWMDPSLPEKLGPFSKCAQGHVAAKPKAGDAVLFYSLRPDGTADPAGLHTGCPVISGIKWAAPVWIHTKPFNPESFARPDARDLPSDPGVCGDYHQKCAQWAEMGECKKNPDFMVGGAGGGNGMCRRSCRVCKVCSEGDWECINENRRQGHFLELDKREMNWLGVDFWEPPEEL